MILKKSNRRDTLRTSLSAGAPSIAPNWLIVHNPIVNEKIGNRQSPVTVAGPAH